MNYYASLQDASSPESGSQYKITDIKISKPSRVTKSPLEDGSISIDNKVIDPKEIIIAGFIDSQAYDNCMEFLEKWRDEKEWKFLRLVSKFEVLDNLILLDINPHETSSRFDVSEVTCKLMQIIVEKNGWRMRDPSNSDTVNNGFTYGV